MYVEYALEKYRKGEKPKVEIIKEFPNSARAKVCALTRSEFKSFQKYRLEIVTPYPNISEVWCRKMGIDYNTEPVYGETEGWVSAGFADVAIDTVSSEKTAKANNLKIFEEILRSYTVIISNKENSSQTKTLFGDQE